MHRLRNELIRRLAKLGVEHQVLPGRGDGFASLSYKGEAFAHFHNDNELDIHLTKSVIVREELTHSANSTVHPNRSANSHWIEIRFTRLAELERVIQLVKLALERI
jgi:Family of unknown function (DUF5519)